MARPRAASDEQIIATAEELADEKGWKAVYGKEVREKLARGGSLSTFTQVINAWRAEKATTNEEVKALASEIVEDRASVLDHGLSAVADALKSMRMAVTAEIDRAVTDERKKSDRIRADERDLHEKSTAALRAEIEALQSENADLAEEAGSEATRADTAEDLAASNDETINQLRQDITNLKEVAEQVPELQSKIESLASAADDLKASTAAQVATAEDREKTAGVAQVAAEKRTEDLRDELKAVSSDLATARTDLATARAERSQSDEKLESAVTDAAKERDRADAAWGRLENLISQMSGKDEADAEGNKAEDG